MWVSGHLRKVLLDADDTHNKFVEMKINVFCFDVVKNSFNAMIFNYVISRAITS